MVYKAIVDFKDLMTGHDYKAGDVYPYEGEADKDRVERLITPTKQRGSLIEEVKEAEPEPAEETVEAEPVEEVVEAEPEVKKRGRRSNKAEQTTEASKEKV